MTEFLMFFAPFIVLIASLLAAFWVAVKDDMVNNEDRK
ncbi:cytochrome bd oxidase small subunit CydS [Priestia flexa]